MAERVGAAGAAFGNRPDRPRIYCRSADAPVRILRSGPFTALSAGLGHFGHARIQRGESNGGTMTSMRANAANTLGAGASRFLGLGGGMTGPPIEEVGPAHVFEAASGGGHGVGSLPLADLAREHRNSGAADVPSSASSRPGRTAPSAGRNSGGRRRGPRPPLRGRQGPNALRPLPRTRIAGRIRRRGSVCKHIVGNRFEQSGCRRSKAGADALLAVECRFENSRRPEIANWGNAARGCMTKNMGCARPGPADRMRPDSVALPKRRNRDDA